MSPCLVIWLFMCVLEILSIGASNLDTQRTSNPSKNDHDNPSDSKPANVRHPVGSTLPPIKEELSDIFKVSKSTKKSKPKPPTTNKRNQPQWTKTKTGMRPISQPNLTKNATTSSKTVSIRTRNETISFHAHPNVVLATRDAVWGLLSLALIVGCLVACACYTRPWRTRHDTWIDTAQPIQPTNFSLKDMIRRARFVSSVRFRSEAHRGDYLPVAVSSSDNDSDEVVLLSLETLDRTPKHSMTQNNGNA